MNNKTSHQKCVSQKGMHQQLYHKCIHGCIHFLVINLSHYFRKQFAHSKTLHPLHVEVWSPGIFLCATDIITEKGHLISSSIWLNPDPASRILEAIINSIIQGGISWLESYNHSNFCIMGVVSWFSNLNRNMCKSILFICAL